MQHYDEVLASILVDETDDHDETIHERECSACGWRVTAVTTYRRNGLPVRVCTCIGDVVGADGSYAGCLARFMPPAEQIPRNLPDGDSFASYRTGTGQTDLSDSLGFSALPDITPPRAMLGYVVEVVPALTTDEVQELRVREGVRDFGFLAGRRDIEYAASVGLDLGEFISGIVASEPDHMVIEGAGLPISSGRKRMRRPSQLSYMGAWRRRTGRSGGVSERQRD